MPSHHYERACVLLSGGLDSTAALHSAIRSYREVRAIGFRYGQPHADAEIAMAGAVADKRGVDYTVLALADALLRTGTGLQRGVVDHDESRAGGVNPAFVTGRNVMFVTLAAVHACSWWPNGNIDIVLGACLEDQAGFPDCKESSMTELGRVLRLTYARELRVAMPFAKLPKAEILHLFRDAPLALDDIQRSWSCYRGQKSGPCGSCTACVVRARAFATVGLDDLSTHPKMFGGDPARDARLAG